MKKGLAIITCDREDFFNQALESINKNEIDFLLVVDASRKSYCRKLAKKNEKVDEVYCFQATTPVGIAKNKAIEILLQNDVEHLFLMEDDVKIIKEGVFDKYIATAAKSGIWGQLSFGGHGNGNKNKDGVVEPSEVVDYEDGIEVDFYQESLAAFCYIHRNILKHIKGFNEAYVNAVEHLHFYEEVARLKLGSFFSYFPDISKSYEYLEDIDNDHRGSVIRKNPKFRDNFENACKIFAKYFDGKNPMQYRDFMATYLTPQQVLERLDYLKENYAREDVFKLFQK